MKKVNLKNNIFLVVKKSKNKAKKLDYYFKLPNGDIKYAFTRRYSTTCYEAFKSGMPINEALHCKKNNIAFMSMVKYLNFMMPYFIDYYNFHIYKKSKRGDIKMKLAQ